MVLSERTVRAAACAGIAFASIALASPQRPDFAAINAASLVPNGPTEFADTDGFQSAQLATRFVITGAATPTATAAKRDAQAKFSVISADAIISNYNAQFGASGLLTTVQAGSSYWINGGSTHNFYGNINNNGRIIVSQTGYLRSNPLAGGQTSDWVGHDTQNGNLNNGVGALIQLNDFGSVSAPTYDWYIRSIINNGTIQWCGRGDTGGSTFQMYSDNDAYNNGLISFEQFSSNLGASFVWRNPVLTTTTTGSNLYNNGAFRIINVVYHNVQNVYGNGCWQIGKGGVLYLEDGTGVFQNPTRGPSFPSQSITFQDPSAVLHMDTAVYSKNSNFGAQVYGFGTGNAIEFYEIISSFSYSSSTGILKVAFIGSNKVNIKLGVGYDASKFVQKKNPQKYNVAGYNAIFYYGMAPSQNAPSQCAISAPICSDLSAGLPPSDSSVSSAVPTTPTLTSTPKSISSTAPAISTSSFTSSNTLTGASSKPISTTTSALSASSPPLSGSSTAIKPSTSSIASVSVTTQPSKSCPGNPNYTPYYPVLTTGYTTDPALTGTTTANQPCPTTPEEGTYCGFINPLDPCAAQPDGYGPVATPDTASAFLAFDELHASASAAPAIIPSTADKTIQYTQVFKDLNGATSAQSYLGLYTLENYNWTECASKCDCTELCTSFNLFAERDPSLNPSKNDSTAYTVWGYWCPNPPSMTSWKCTLWGSAINNATATNTGSKREDFDVVITASDGWTKTNLTVPRTPSGTLPPTNCNGKAIDAPASYLDSKFFPGPFNTDVCDQYAHAQAAVNVQSGARQSVAMYNAYYLYKNGKPLGTQCALYSMSLDVGVYATYDGEVVNGDQFQVQQSWTFTFSL